MSVSTNFIANCSYSLIISVRHLLHLTLGETFHCSLLLFLCISVTVFVKRGRGREGSRGRCVPIHKPLVTIREDHRQLKVRF